MRRNVDSVKLRTSSVVHNNRRPLMFLVILISGVLLMGCGVSARNQTPAKFPFLPFNDVSTDQNHYFDSYATVKRLDELAKDPQHTFFLETASERYVSNLTCSVIVDGVAHEMKRDQGRNLQQGEVDLWIWTADPPLAKPAAYYFSYSWNRPLYGHTNALCGSQSNPFLVKPIGYGYGVIILPEYAADSIDGVSFPPIGINVIKGQGIPEIIVQSLNPSDVLRVGRVELVNIVGEHNDNQLFEFVGLPPEAADPSSNSTAGYHLQFGQKLRFRVNAKPGAYQPGPKICYISMIISDSHAFRTEHIKINLIDGPG